MQPEEILSIIYTELRQKSNNLTLYEERLLH